MKVQNPIIGRARGSAGGMTFCKNYDKNVARAKAFEVSNPKTPAQENQRTYFKELSGLVAQFSNEELRTLFPNKPKAMSRRNALSKQLAEDVNFVNNQKVIDYAAIDTLGNASTIDFGDVEVVLNGNVFEVSLNDFSGLATQYKDNNFIVALVNANIGEILLAPETALVQVASVEIPKPSNWTANDSITAIPFVLDLRDSQAQTVNFGSVAVIKRPAKASV